MRVLKVILVFASVATAGLVFSHSLSAIANGRAGPMISAGRWEDAFDDATGLETMNQTSVSDGLLRLSDNIHQVWEISSQVSFQAGNLNQVDAQAQPGALQLALQDLDFSPNQLVSVTPDNSFGFLPYFTPPALVNDGGQTLHLAWADGLQYDIHYRCSLDAGENWEVLDPLTGDGATTVQDSPAMVVGATGGVYVVWYDEQVDSDGDIYLAYRAGCNSSWNTPAPVPVAALAGVAEDAPSLAIDDAGKLHLAWTANGNIYFSFSDDGGLTWKAAQQLNDASGAVANAPDLVVDPAGQEIGVVWEYDLPAAEQNIYFARSGDGGLAWSTNQPVAPDAAEFQYAPAISRSSNGNLYVAWAAGGIFTARSLDGGQNWQPPVSVHDEPLGRFWGGVDLIVDREDTIFLAWHDARHTVFIPTPPNWYFDVFLSYSEDDGQSWSANIQLNDDPVVNPGIDQ